MAYQSEVNAVLVTGVPRSISSSVARLKLTIHFQRGAVSGGADVDEVRESDREDSAYEVYFTGEQASDAVKTVLTKRSQDIYFGDKGHSTCDVHELSRPHSHYKMTANEGERKNVASTGHTPGSFQDEWRKPKERAPILDSHTISLSEAEMRQLKMSNFSDKIKQSFPHVLVSFGKVTPTVDLKGTQEDVKDVTLLTYRHLRNLPVARIARPISQSITDFLQSPKGESAVIDYFRVRQIQACYFADNGDFKCSGINEKLTEHAKRFIEEEITDRRLDFKDKAVTVVKSRKFSEIIRKLEEDHECLSVDITRHGDVVIVGKNSSVTIAMENIRKYISSNVETELFVPMESGKRRFLCDREEFLKFKQTTGQCLKIQVQRNGEKQGVKILGVKDDVDNALSQLKSMLDKIAKRRHTVANPGMQQIIKDRDANGYLRLIEADCNCKIDVAEESTSQLGDQSYKELPTSPKGTESCFKTIFEHTRKDGRRIVVVKGDITKLEVDAIATTATRNLGPLEGLCSLIRDAGGRQMKIECEELLRQNRTSFVTGEAVSTRAGMMPCDRVIYVIGPEWDESAGESKMVDLLTDAIDSSLKVANEHTCRTVAIPPISTEFGFPLVLCVDTIVKAVDEYLKDDKTSVTKIFLIHQVARKCKAFEEAVKSSYGLQGDDVKNHDPEPEKESEKTTMYGLRSDSNVSVSSMAPSPVTHTITYIDQTRVMTKEGKNVNLVVGDMATQKVDIMVNSIGVNLDLTAGAASKAINSAAGNKLKRELSAVTKGRPPKAGDAFVTGGAKLSVKYVIHTICCGWTSPHPEKTLRDIMRECFRIAVYKSAISIAIPAIGTGNLGFPRDVVAKIMYDEAEIFSRNHPTSALTDINFVVYTLDQLTIQSFKNKIQMYASQQPIDGGHSAVDKPRRHERGSLSRVQVHGAAASPIPDSSRLKLAKGEPLYKDLDLQDVGWQMSIGSIRFHVIAGDITSEKVDAIVTEINKDLEPTTDISALIINKGGAEVRRELKSLAKHHHSKAHITAAGELPCKKLIHAVMENTKVKTVIQAILELADTSLLTSIAMPFIGLGHGNKDAKEIAHKTLKRFSKFVENNKETVVNTIKIVTLQTRLVEVYNQAMIDIIGDQEKTSKSGISKMFKLPSTNKPEIGEEDVTIPVIKQETRMVLDIYADTERHIDRAVETIETFLARELNTFEIDKPSVKSLTSRKIEEIAQYAIGCNVDFKRIITGRVHHLKLHGMPRDIIKVSSKINDILDKIEKEEQSHREAEILSKNVKWCFKDGENYEEYERKISTLIEQACHKRQPEVEFEIHGGRYKIIFKRMVEISIEDGSEVPVQRFLTEDAIPLPPNWEPMSPDEPFLSVTLDRLTPEYESVKSAFIERLAETHKITDIQIERVQNSKLYRQYIISKQNMTARLSGVQIERMLYHGTKESSCSLINANGFNRSFAGQNAALYGNGCYFAVQSQYSAGGTYSPPDVKGYKYIYQCSVLTGEYAPGHRGMLVPPPKNKNKPTVCYESVVDKLDDPKIFVIFNDAVAYPEYLIKFKEEL